MGYYNSGFLSGLGTVIKSVGPYIAAAGSIAAEVLPAIYHTGGTAAQQTPAAGPTGAPAMGMKGTALVKQPSAIQRGIQAAEHPILATEKALGLGGKAKTVKLHPDGTLRVHHHRRMNPCNIKALRRSMRRAYAFERIAKRVLHMTSPKHHVSGFKKPRRRAR